MPYIPLFPGFQPTTLLGKGASAQVYLAIQESLNRHVALKVLNVSGNNPQHFSEAFLRESRLLSQLHHPHIVPIYDIGEADGHLFIAMEYIPGGTLRDRMKMGIRVSEALKIMRELASALSFAHGKGLVHRDIKPDNVMLREDDSIVLMDFGISLDTIEDDNHASKTVLGSPNYMSPEHHRGQPLDARSDLYSLGVLLYQMLTGTLPFNARTPKELAELKTRQLPPALPENLQAFQQIVLQLLESHIDLRYQSALQLLQDLKSLRIQSEVSVTVQENSMANDTRNTTDGSNPQADRHHLAITEKKYWTLLGRKVRLEIDCRTDDFLVFDSQLSHVIEALLKAHQKYGGSLKQVDFQIAIHPWIQSRVRDRVKNLRKNQGLGFMKKVTINATLEDDVGQPLEQIQLLPEA